MRCAETTCAIVLFAVAFAFETACSNSAPAPPRQAQTAPPAQAAPPPQAAPLAPQSAAAAAPVGPAALATAQWGTNPLIRCDILEVKRVSGNALLARWRLVNTGAAAISYDFGWNDLYYIDPAENKKYSYLTDSEGTRILQAKWGSMAPGEQWLNWAKFPAPPATSTKISLNIGGFAPFEDVPVGP